MVAMLQIDSIFALRVPLRIHTRNAVFEVKRPNISLFWKELFKTQLWQLKHVGRGYNQEMRGEPAPTTRHTVQSARHIRWEAWHPTK